MVMNMAAFTSLYVLAQSRWRRNEEQSEEMPENGDTVHRAETDVGEMEMQGTSSKQKQKQKQRKHEDAQNRKDFPRLLHSYLQPTVKPSTTLSRHWTALRKQVWSFALPHYQPQTEPVSRVPN